MFFFRKNANVDTQKSKKNKQASKQDNNNKLKPLPFTPSSSIISQNTPITTVKGKNKPSMPMTVKSHSPNTNDHHERNNNNSQKLDLEEVKQTQVTKQIRPISVIEKPLSKLPLNMSLSIGIQLSADENKTPRPSINKLMGDSNNSLANCVAPQLTTPIGRPNLKRGLGNSNNSIAGPVLPKLTPLPTLSINRFMKDSNQSVASSVPSQFTPIPRPSIDRFRGDSNNSMVSNVAPKLSTIYSTSINNNNIALNSKVTSSPHLKPPPITISSNHCTTFKISTPDSSNLVATPSNHDCRSLVYDSPTLIKILDNYPSSKVFEEVLETIDLDKDIPEEMNDKKSWCPCFK